MKKFYVLFVSLFIAYSAGSQGWKIQDPLPQGHELSCIRFTDPDTGYTVGAKGTILKTTNGGIDWTSQVSGTSVYLSSVFFTVADTGYAVGDSGTILKTTNGGITWTNQVSGTSEYLSSVFFTDANTGYIVGNNTILKTTNGGINWTIQIFGIEAPLYSVYFTKPNTGYTVGYEGTLLITHDYGITWKVHDRMEGELLHSVCFADANTGFAVGFYMFDWEEQVYNGAIYKTKNGGESWKRQYLGYDDVLYSVYFPDPDTGYAVGTNGEILKSTDCGTTWKKQVSGTKKYLRSVYFTDANTGYAVGEKGIILKTTDGGGYPSGLNELSGNLTDLKIYPNPAQDKFTIDLSELQGDAFLLVNDVNGQMVLEQKITEPISAIDVSALPDGIYFVKVVGEKGVQTGKLVKL